MKTLLLLRHAKSDWNHPDLTDHQRPINSRGQKAAAKIGKWMKENHVQPEWIICSSATRARETLAVISEHLHTPESLMHFSDDVYLADVETLLQVLAGCPEDIDHVLLIGHNPGMEELLTYLCGEELPLSDNGKLIPTATLAQITMPDDWQKLQHCSAKLSQIIRPKEL